MDHPHRQHHRRMAAASCQALSSQVRVDYSGIVDILERPLGCRVTLGIKCSTGLCIVRLTSVVKHLETRERSISSYRVSVISWFDCPMSGPLTAPTGQG
jgi:hypothetical protein